MPFRPVRDVLSIIFFFFQAEDGIRDGHVTGVQTCALPISLTPPRFPRLSFLPRAVGLTPPLQSGVIANRRGKTRRRAAGWPWQGRAPAADGHGEESGKVRRRPR